MSIELSLKNFTIDEVYNVAVNNHKVKVGRILSNELSQSKPKKVKAKNTELVDIKYPTKIRKTEYLRAYILLTLSHLARMGKAGSANTVKLLTSLLNARLGDSKTPALPKGITSDSTNIIQCLCDTLSQEGLVEADGQETKFDQLLDIDLDADDEEEVKEEPPTPLQAMLPQEYFYINTKRTYKVGVAAVEAHRWAKLSNRLFTSFALSAQACGAPSAAFTELCMTQGIGSKQALNVKNRLVAMLDKSAGLGKSSTPEDSKQITEMFNLLLNFLQYLQNLNSMIKDELNSSLPVLFSDKKADSFQEFFDRTESSVRITIETFINILISISKNKLQTLIKLGDDVTEFTKELEDIISSECVLVKLSGLSLLERIILREEFLSYQILKAKNDEAIAKIIKKRDELLAAGKQFKGEIKGMKLGKGTLDYLEFLDKNQVEDFDSFSTLTDISNTDYEKILCEITEVQNQQMKKPKCAKGTRDMNPLQAAIKERAIERIKSVFQRHGASEIDTPVFERKETLTGKYGEESKLIYDLEDQGGELLSLRYDLTVPFARYVAENGITNIKRFHIAKVYRRDQPQMSKGRFREFYQCDFDIAGNTSSMIPDAEVLKVVTEILTELEVGGFVVKLNNRKFLDSIIDICGCDKSQFKTICSSIDKLDKEPWEKVEEELIKSKGLTKEMTTKLWEFVKRKGHPLEMLEEIKSEGIFGDHELANETIAEMELLFNYLDALNCLDKISFDFSLARGLDYYTGVIYEAVLTDEGKLGSIAGGGRYDELVGMFSGQNIPAVGVSIGIERIFILLEEKARAENDIKATKTQVLVASVGKGLTKERFRTCNLLWSADIKAETMYNENLKPQKQLKFAFDSKVPLIIWIGEDEVAEGVVKVKILNTKEERVIKFEELVPEIQTLIQENPVLTASEAE